MDLVYNINCNKVCSHAFLLNGPILCAADEKTEKGFPFNLHAQLADKRRTNDRLS